MGNQDNDRRDRSGSQPLDLTLVTLRVCMWTTINCTINTIILILLYVQRVVLFFQTPSFHPFLSPQDRGGPHPKTDLVHTDCSCTTMATALHKYLYRYVTAVVTCRILKHDTEGQRDVCNLPRERITSTFLNKFCVPLERFLTRIAIMVATTKTLHLRYYCLYSEYYILPDK